MTLTPCASRTPHPSACRLASRAAHPSGLRLARRVATGAAFINATTASDARLPLGGTKKSGHGRELAAAGVRAFCNTRTYWVKP